MKRKKIIIFSLFCSIILALLAVYKFTIFLIPNSKQITVLYSFVKSSKIQGMLLYANGKPLENTEIIFDDLSCGDSVFSGENGYFSYDFSEIPLAMNWDAKGKQYSIKWNSFSWGEWNMTINENGIIMLIIVHE